MGDVFLHAFIAAIYPTLFAATTIMMLLPRPKLLMLGYLLGGMTVGLTIGFVVVFALKDSGAVHTTRHQVSPGIYIGLGLIALLIAFVLYRDQDKRYKEFRVERKQKKGKKVDTGPPKWQRTLSKGSPRTTYVVGILLSFPGPNYLIALNDLVKQKLSVILTILVVIAINLVIFLLLEIPLLCYAIAPQWTTKMVAKIKKWISRNGRKFSIRGSALVGVVFIIIGVLNLILQ